MNCALDNCILDFIILQLILGGPFYLALMWGFVINHEPKKKDKKNENTLSENKSS